jgi:hypothetical protein
MKAYHVASSNFNQIGANSSIGIHITPNIESSLQFAYEWYLKTPFYFMTLDVDLKNPLEFDDIGIFHSPMLILTQLFIKNLININEFKSTASKFGASTQITPYDYEELEIMGHRDTNDENDKNKEFNPQDIQFIKKDQSSYAEMEPVRKLFTNKGYDSIKYYNRVDAEGWCYVVFYQSQIKTISKKQFGNYNEFEKWYKHTNNVSKMASNSNWYKNPYKPLNS